MSSEDSSSFPFRSTFGGEGIIPILFRKENMMQVKCMKFMYLKKKISSAPRRSTHALPSAAVSQDLISRPGFLRGYVTKVACEQARG